MKSCTTWALLAIAFAVVLKLAYKTVTPSISSVWETRLRSVQNVILSEESKDFTLGYNTVKGYNIPFLSPYLNTVDATRHGTVTRYYGVTIDSITNGKVFYTPYSSPPRLELHMDSIDDTTFAEYSAEDAESVQKLALEKAPAMNLTPVCIRFDSIVTALTSGSWRGVKNE